MGEIRTGLRKEIWKEVGKAGRRLDLDNGIKEVIKKLRMMKKRWEKQRKELQKLMKEIGKKVK